MVYPDQVMDASLFTQPLGTSVLFWLIHLHLGFVQLLCFMVVLSPLWLAYVVRSPSSPAAAVGGGGCWFIPIICESEGFRLSEEGWYF